MNKHEINHYAVHKKTGELLFGFSEQDKNFAIGAAIAITPIFLGLVFYVGTKLGIFDWVIEKIKFTINFYLG